MANTITVFSATDLKNALKANADDVLTLRAKKEDKKYTGSKFMNASFNIGEKKNAEGWFNVSNIPIRGTADPNNKADKRNDYKGTRNQLDSTVSKGGDWGEAMSLLDPVWKKRVNEQVEKDEFSLKGRQVHDLVGWDFSDEYKKKNPDKVKTDPDFHFKMDFGNFPEKYPHKKMAGTQKTQIFDYNTAYTDENGNVQYKRAMVCIDGKDVLVDESNHHLFITDGSVIRSGRVNMPSACQSAGWISMSALMTRCVIEPGGEELFSDELPASAIVNTNVTPKTVTNNQVITNVNTNDAINTNVTTNNNVVNNVATAPVNVPLSEVDDMLDKMGI